MSKPADSVVRQHRPAGIDVVTLNDLIKAKAGTAAEAFPESPQTPSSQNTGVPEIGGRKNGLDPTRYGDWEKDGRCIDF